MTRIARHRLVPALAAAARRVALAPFAPAPPPPPIGTQPDRYGNGRVEVQVYTHATDRDRLAAAVCLLAGTAFRIVPDDAP